MSVLLIHFDEDLDLDGFSDIINGLLFIIKTNENILITIIKNRIFIKISIVYATKVFNYCNNLW
jgi:hypothetical protein